MGKFEIVSGNGGDSDETGPFLRLILFAKRYTRSSFLFLIGLILCASYILYDYVIYQDLLIVHFISPPHLYEFFSHILMMIGAPAVFMAMGIQDYKKTKLMKELEEMTEKWRKTYDSMPDLIFVLDNDHRVVDANKATIERWGNSIFGTQFCYSNLGQKCIPHSTCPHNRCITANITVREELSNGSAFELTCSPIMRNNGDIIGSVHIVKDVTEKRRAAEDKRNLEAQLLQAQKMESLGRFAGGIAHDFNTYKAPLCQETNDPDRK